MYLRSAGIWDICFCFFGVFFLLLFAKVIGDRLEKRCNGKIATLICVALALAASLALTSVVAAPVADFLEALTGWKDLL